MSHSLPVPPPGFDALTVEDQIDQCSRSGITSQRPSTRMEAVQARRWTRPEYGRMVEAGILTPEDHVELIDGEILTVTPQGSAHAASVSLASEALRIAFGGGVYVRAQLPLATDAESEPEPDISVVSGSPRDHRDTHPQSALLVVEISDSTLAYDRSVKGSLYARAGVREYWIVNLVESVVEVYLNPVAQSHARFGWLYGSIQSFGPGDSIVPLARTAAPVKVADLLP